MVGQSPLFLLSYFCKRLVRAGKFASFVTVHDDDHGFGAKQEKIRILIVQTRPSADVAEYNLWDLVAWPTSSLNTRNGRRFPHNVDLLGSVTDG